MSDTGCGFERAIAATPALIVAAARGAMYSSADAISWTPRLANARGQINRVVFAGGRFVTLG